jgi:hypothetical protein
VIKEVRRVGEEEGMHGGSSTQHERIEHSSSSAM